MYLNRKTRFKIVGNYLFFFIGSFGKSSVFWCHAQKSKNAHFAVIFKTISKNESGLSVWNTYFQTLPENIWEKNKDKQLLLFDIVSKITAKDLFLDFCAWHQNTLDFSKE